MNTRRLARRRPRGFRLIVIPPDQLRPMRRKGQPTKRANERRTKGYAR